MKLSKRLISISNFIDDNSKVIDVGCDHALLDIYLFKNKKNISLIASDVRSGPLKQAKRNIDKYNCDIKVKLGYGISTIESDVDTVVIAGMGGDTIVDILNNDSELNIGVSSIGEINLIDEEIKELLSSDRDVVEIISKVKNLNDKKKSLEEHTLLNVNQKPVSLYYKSLRALFTYNPIDMIAMEDVDKVLNFFNYQIYNEKEFYKSIKRIKKENN